MFRPAGNAHLTMYVTTSRTPDVVISPLVVLNPSTVDRPFMDRPFMDRPFMDRPFMDRPFMDRPFMDRPFIDRPFSDSVAARMSESMSSGCSSQPPKLNTAPTDSATVMPNLTFPISP